jgi:hypothetical protein
MKRVVGGIKCSEFGDGEGAGGQRREKATRNSGIPRIGMTTSESEFKICADKCFESVNFGEEGGGECANRAFRVERLIRREGSRSRRKAAPAQRDGLA